MGLTDGTGADGPFSLSRLSHHVLGTTRKECMVEFYVFHEIFLLEFTTVRAVERHLQLKCGYLL